MIRTYALIAVLAACSSHRDYPHWSTRALVQAEGKTVLGNVPFTIGVPEGYSALSVPTSFTYTRNDGVESYLEIQVFDHDKEAMADELKKLGADAQPFAQRDQPDGWAFAIHDPKTPKAEDYIVHTAKFVGDRELECIATASRLHDEDVKALCPKIEDICMSVAPKAP